MATYLTASLPLSAPRRGGWGVRTPTRSQKSPNRSSATRSSRYRSNSGRTVATSRSRGTRSAYSVPSRVPSMLPPTKTAYLLSERPTNARSAVYGRAQPFAQPAIDALLDAAVLDEEPQKRAAVILRVPAEMVLDARHFDRCGRRERAPEVTLHLAPEPVEPLCVDQVLEARVAAIAAVAVVTLHLHHRLRNLDDVPRPGEAQRIGKPRIRVFLPVRFSHAPAHQHVEAVEAATCGNHQEAQVVRVDVAAIVVRKRERDLELAREIARAVDRLGFFPPPPLSA